MDWHSSEPQWRRALAWYGTALTEHEASHTKKDGLCELEEQLATTLTKALQQDPAHMTSTEYSTLVKWKLKRGKWRPRLQGFADALSGDSVRECSTSALKHLGDGEVRRAISALVELRGCGPATASAVLAFADASVPFMGDELLESVPAFGGRRDYTLKAYMTLVGEVRTKVKDLSGDWNARKVEQAVFAATVAKRLGREAELEAAAEVVGTEDKTSTARKRGRGKNTDEGTKQDDEEKGVPAREEDRSSGKTKRKRKKLATVDEDSKVTRRTSARLRKN